MKAIALPQLAELEALRKNRVIMIASMIGDDTLRVLYECLRRRSRCARLDLVLSTGGGLVTTARQIALLLREYTDYLTIFVPYRARSSGTLLCLSADELVLGPMAELGPIDSHIGSAGTPPPGAPSMISVEDIRSFRDMATEWFGVDREEDRLQVLALVAQRVFPTSLSSFYRFDRLIKKIANELLERQLPNAGPDIRTRIVNQLVNGYYAHDYTLSRAEVRELGLKARDASPEEEMLLWALITSYREHMPEQTDETEQRLIGLIAATDFYAHQTRIEKCKPSSQSSDSQEGNIAQLQKQTIVKWEINP